MDQRTDHKVTLLVDKYKFGIPLSTNLTRHSNVAKMKVFANVNSENEMKHDVLIMIVCVLVFFFPSLFRVMTQDFPIEELVVGIDDWNRYARHALDIKQHGLLIENVRGEYLIPAGFLYNYFVAGIFVLFGDHPAVVYVIQGILLGASIALTYFVFKDKIKLQSGYLLLTLLILFAFIDIYKNYTFRLFSENLAIFTIALFFFLLKKSWKSDTLRWHFFAGLFLGASVLIRPNILPFSLVFLLLYLIPKIVRKPHFIRASTFLLGFLLVLLLLPLRNILVCGSALMLPVDGTFMDYMHRINPVSMYEHPIAFLKVYFNRIFYCLGDIPILNPEFKLRPHWFMMWGGFIYLLFQQLKYPKQREAFAMLLVLFVIAFYLTLILIARIEVYGHRMLIPALPVVLGLCVMGYERAWLHIRERS